MDHAGLEYVDALFSLPHNIEKWVLWPETAKARMISGNHPNILLLMIDALWFDRLACSGHTPSAATFIDGMIEKGVAATSLFATGCPTQFAFPGIFTSTLPLDDNGYGTGIRDRGTSFVEILHDAGYATAGFVSAGWGNRLYGYDRGFETFHELFDLSLLVRIVRDYQIGHYARLAANGTIPPRIFHERNGPFLDLVFPALLRFCLDKMQEVGTGTVMHSPVIHGWDFRKVIRLVQEEQLAFAASSRTYMDKLIAAWESNPLFGAVGSARCAPQAASGAYVVDSLCSWIERQRKRPFFAWAHFMDVHESSYSTYDYLPPRVQLQRDIGRILEIHGRILAEGKSYRSNLEHDYALAYLDEQISRLYNFLLRKALLDDTLIVLASDHGCRTAGHPRPDFKDITAFYDQLYHVPLAFIHRSLAPRRVDALCSTMDLAPTLLDLVGIRPPETFRGAPIHSDAPANRDHLIMEHVGRGPCDLDLKPVNVCIRTRTVKAVFRSEPARGDAKVTLVELYDLTEDRDELHNLAGVRGEDRDIAALATLAQRRVSEVRRHVATTGVTETAFG